MGWLQAHRHHLVCPLFIVRVRWTWRASVVLPVVRHLMHKGGHHSLYRLQREESGVHTQLVKHLAIGRDEPTRVVVTVDPARGAQR